MSQLLKIYNNLKIQDSETIYLFKSGIFYLALNEDAKFLSKELNFKLTNLNKTAVKCGFPTRSFKKYYALLQNYNLKIKIIENNTIFSLTEYHQSQILSNIIIKIQKIDINYLSISEAYKFIEELQIELKQL